MIHFISDLHLSPKRPETTAAFLHYLSGPARHCDTLYVLGDLFDAWPGDDVLVDPSIGAFADALGSLAASGVRIAFMAGNRDFLVDQAFATRASVTLLTEPERIELGRKPFLLMHGDSLCTDDVEYQRFRAMVRDPQWRAAVLAKPLAERLAMAAEARSESERSKQNKSTEIMDVNADAVEQVLREHAYPNLIHGHTHRPALHLQLVDGHTCERWVLHDWHDTPRWLAWNETAGLRFESL